MSEDNTWPDPARPGVPHHIRLLNYQYPILHLAKDQTND
jgi:hypothetical protein